MSQVDNIVLVFGVVLVLEESMCVVFDITVA